MAAMDAAEPVCRRAARLFRHRATLGDMRDTEIVSRYRLTRQGIALLVDMVGDELETGMNQSHPIPVLTQVLIGLRYLAKGELLSEVADLHGVSRSSACHIIDRFVDAVNRRMDNIRFPDDRALIDVKQGNFRKCRIPNTVGAVDGTLIPIIAPTENEAVFVDIVSKWPGSTHDASIFDNCGLKAYMERHEIGHLLGDSGYALKKYLLTPLLHPAAEREVAYNRAQSCGRMVVERAFGLMKSRFRCLHKTGGVLYKKPGKCCQIIVACARLHNFCSFHNIPMPDNEELIVDEQQEIHEVNPDVNAVAYRQHIINLFH